MGDDNLLVNLSASKPRAQKHADKPGRYALVIESSQPEAYPGESIILKVFFTGYGEISSPKLHITLPPGLHDPDDSYIYSDIGAVRDRIVFGKTKQKLTGGKTYILQGASGTVSHPWNEPTFMIDISNGHGMIITESTAGRAPFELEIKVKRRSILKYIRDKNSRLRSGRHYVKFVFTYFNGEVWTNEQKSHAVIVSSWYQQHLLLTWLIALVLTCATIVLTVIGLLHATN